MEHGGGAELGRGRGKRPAHLAFLDEEGGSGGRSHRNAQEEEEEEVVVDRARFIRDEHGELIVIKPGKKIHKEEKTAEDLQYEAYLHGRASGAVRAINGYSDGIDRAAAADSASARDAEEREAKGGGRKYAPSRAYDKRTRLKRQGNREDRAAGEATKTAAASMEEAMRRAREASDDDDDDELLCAAALADRAMAIYNEPISNLLQRDVHGNDLRLPSLERKSRRFMECFAEDISVKTWDGKPVLKDFDALRKRYATVFRESGVNLRGDLRHRFRFEPEDPNTSGSITFCLDFERHSGLVTPRPGLALDGSMGVTAPREQDLIVLYSAEGGEISQMWIAPDKEGLGDPSTTREAIEASKVYQNFVAIIKEANSTDLVATYKCPLGDVTTG